MKKIPVSWGKQGRRRMPIRIDETPERFRDLLGLVDALISARGLNMRARCAWEGGYGIPSQESVHHVTLSINRRRLISGPEIFKYHVELSSDLGDMSDHIRYMLVDEAAKARLDEFNGYIEQLGVRLSDSWYSTYSF